MQFKDLHVGDFMKTPEIPNVPRIKIQDYWCTLPNSTSVILKKDMLKPLLTDDLLNDISFALGVRQKSFNKNLRKNKYSLSFLKELQTRLPNIKLGDLIQKSNPRFFSRWKSVNLPTHFTPKFAYYVGYLYGDGSVEKSGKRINFADEYLSQMERMNILTYELFDIKGLIQEVHTFYSKKASYRLWIGSKILNAYLHSLFGLNQGVKKNLHIPKAFISHKKLLSWFLKGVFDADGTLPKNPLKVKQLFIDLTMKDKCFIEEVKTVLIGYGVPTLKLFCRKKKSPDSDFISHTWEIRIRKRADILMFLKEVGFSHPDKRRRAKEIFAIHAPVAQLG